MRYALKFGYNGREYSGYARQPNLRTIEGEIFVALLEARMIADPGHFKIDVASRTDKGVSAMGNVISFSTDFREGEIISALNAYLKDIWFYGIAKVPDDFNPRHAKKRWYRYHILSDEYDLDNLQKTADIFVGTHNFSNFAKLEENDPTITIDSIDIKEENGMIVVDIRAQYFLWHLVRRIMNALFNVERGKITHNYILHALETQEKIDLGIAPPRPLLLMDVKYNFDFEVDHKRMGNLLEKLERNLYDLQLTSIIYRQMQNILVDR